MPVQRKAIASDPPPVPPGRPRCPCCDGPLGAPSWDMTICIVCHDATTARRADPTVHMAQTTPGGWRTVTFRRKHRTCPLSNLPLERAL